MFGQQHQLDDAAGILAVSLHRHDLEGVARRAANSAI
jgi:hypothetical protein